MDAIVFVARLLRRVGPLALVAATVLGTPEPAYGPDSTVWPRLEWPGYRRRISKNDRTPEREVALIQGAIVVATIVGVSPEPATNGKPPRVDIFVEETLRGPARKGLSVLRWLTRRHVAWRFPVCGVISKQEELDNERAQQQWRARVLKKPRLGSTMILSVGHNGIVPLGLPRYTRAVVEHGVKLRRRWQEIRENGSEWGQLKALSRDVEQTSWRRRTTPDVVIRRARKAQFVAVVRSESSECGQHQACDLRVLSVLKSDPVDRHRTFIRVGNLRGNFHGLVNTNQDYLVFLSRRTRRGGESYLSSSVEIRESLVPATPTLVRAVLDFVTGSESRTQLDSVSESSLVPRSIFRRTTRARR